MSKEDLKIHIHSNTSEGEMYIASRAELDGTQLDSDNKFPYVEMRISVMKTYPDHKQRIGFEFVSKGARREDNPLLDTMTAELIKMAHNEWDVFNKPVKLSWKNGFHLITSTQGLIYSDTWNEE